MEAITISELHLNKIFHKLSLGLLNAENQTDEEYWQQLFEETKRGKIWVTDDASVGHSIYVMDTNGVDKNKLLCCSINSGHDR